MKKKDNKGITLVSLTITIIVILILASITVGSLSSQNNVLNGAKGEKEYREGLVTNTEREIDQLYNEMQATD